MQTAPPCPWFALPTSVLRAASVLGVAAMLVTAVIGGLLRAGVTVPGSADAVWLGQATLAHGFLMICGFMGTVIGIERAVAVKYRSALLAPTASALAGMSMLAGFADLAAWLAVAAATGFIAVNAIVVTRQPALHTALLLAGAAAWMAGNLLYALGAHSAPVIALWFSFLVLTIAAERLEMTRLMRRRRGAAAALHACLGGMLLGAGLLSVTPVLGGIVYGVSLAGLAGWMIVFDIARRTIAANGLSRYMAVCLLLGYLWLAIAGAAWAAAALGFPARDAALHALGLGFIFSMMLGHAPVILPSLARVKLLFGWFFYIPLVLLHASLIARLGFGPASGMRAWGAQGNALAIAVFAMTMAASALAWRMRARAQAQAR